MALLLLGVALVVGLLLWRCPSAILWCVWAVYVDAVDAVSEGWSRAHICIEQLKAVQPSTAHRDAARSIVAVILILWIVASVFDSAPSVVFDASRHAVGAAPHAVGLSSPASTTLGIAVSQRVRRVSNELSTIAAAIVGSELSDVSVAPEHRQVPKSLPGNVDECRHVSLCHTGKALIRVT
jgi:hypothetical protein